MRDDLKWNAELCCERPTKRNRDTAVATAVLDRELRGWRGATAIARRKFPVGASSFNTAATAMGCSKKSGGKCRRPSAIACRAYGFIPAGATWEFFRSIASKASRTIPVAFASSTN